MFSDKTFANLSIIIISVFYVVGLIGISFSSNEQWFVNQTPWLILTGGGLLFLNHRQWSLHIVFLMLGVFLVGFATEAVGVNTGKIFGHYSYGDTLGVQFFDTPVLIGLNWLVLVYCVYIIFQPLKITLSLKALLGAFVLTVFDLNMEPIAIRMGMWSWDFIDVPVSNYFTWFVISAAMLLAFYKIDKEKSSNIFAAYYFIFQLLFFFLLHLLWV